MPLEMDGPLFTSGKDEWTTPLTLFKELHREFDFTVDLAATRDNTLCLHFYSQEHDALAQDWSVEFPRQAGFCNPPYSRSLQKRFIEKAAFESNFGFTTVMLLPARTDTIAFHKWIYDRRTWRPHSGVDVRFLKGRLHFGGEKNGAPFPSMIVIFRG
jgi:phage N-6-adenine-methyltransferase